MPEAPMPREKNGTRIVIEVVFGAAQGVELKLTAECEPAKPLCCIGDCCRRPAIGAAIAHAMAQHAGCLGGLAMNCDHCGGGMQPRVLVAQPMGLGSAVYGSAQYGCMPHPAYGHSLIGKFGAYCGPMPHPFVTAIPQQGSCIIRIGGQYPLHMMPPMPPPVFTCPVPPPGTVPQMFLSPPIHPQTVRPQSCGAPNDPMKQLAVDAFGDLLIQSGVTHPQCIPTQPQMLTITTLPAKPGIIGTWHREIGAKRCVIQVLPDHMVLCVSESREIEGKVVTAHLTFTVDYHLTRDGVTAVGLITSVDMTFDGDIPESETDGMLESVAEFRKAMEDKPFAMTCRMYGDALVIGNVRMPAWKDQRDQPSAYISGRYTNTADKPMPKLKTIKAEEPQAISPYGLPPITAPALGAGIGSSWAPSTPNVFVAPAGNVLPPLGTNVVPCPGVVPSVPVSDVLPTMPIPTPPAPTMSDPVPPGQPVSEAPRIMIPNLCQPTLVLDFKIPLIAPSDRRPLVNFSAGLFDDGAGCGLSSASGIVSPAPNYVPQSDFGPVPPLPPPAFGTGPLSIIVPPLGNGSFLRSVMNAKPENRQLYNFGVGLFGSQ